METKRKMKRMWTRTWLRKGGQFGMLILQKALGFVLPYTVQVTNVSLLEQIIPSHIIFSSKKNSFLKPHNGTVLTSVSKSQHQLLR